MTIPKTDSMAAQKQKKIIMYIIWLEILHQKEELNIYLLAIHLMEALI